VIKRFEICKICLSPHRTNECNSKKICGKNGCNLLHHSLLHWENNNSTAAEIPTEQTVSAHQDGNQAVLYKIIAVIIYGKNKVVNTFAYLDDGSSATLMDHKLCEYLEFNRTPDPTPYMFKMV
jgi:hypothetical protein